MQRSIIPAACLILIVHALSALGKPVGRTPIKRRKHREKLSGLRLGLRPDEVVFVSIISNGDFE